jgi:hypothetical protein
MTKAERDERLGRAVAGLEALRADLAFPIEARLPITHAVLARLDDACAEVKGVLGDGTDDAEAPASADTASTQVPEVPPASAGGAAADPATGTTTSIPFSKPLSEGDTSSMPSSPDYDPAAQAEAERDAASRQHAAERGDPAAKVGPPPDGDVVELREPAVPGLSDDQIASLRAAGYGDAASIRAASDEDLLKVDGIGPAAIRRLREAAKA